MMKKNIKILVNHFTNIQKIKIKTHQIKLNQIIYLFKNSEISKKPKENKILKKGTETQIFTIHIQLLN